MICKECGGDLSEFPVGNCTTVHNGSKPEAPTICTCGMGSLKEHAKPCALAGKPIKPAKDAGAREWPTEMLKNLDASLKLQSMLAAPDHAWIGPSVIEVATAAYEKLERELAEAERRLFESAIKNANEFLHLREQLTQERTRSAALVEALRKIRCCKRPSTLEGCSNEKLAREALAKWSKHD